MRGPETRGPETPEPQRRESRRRESRRREPQPRGSQPRGRQRRGADARCVAGTCAASLAALLVAGCGDEGGGGAPRPDASFDASLEVGTGRDAYVALSDDDLVALTRGEQAGGRLDGFHIFMGLALTGVSREEITAVTFQIADVDGAVRAEVVRSGPMSGFLGDDGVRLVVAGVQPRIDDCCAVANGEVDLRGAVDLSDGTRLEDGVRVRTGQCLDGAVDVCE